jgi:hypothetical protein
VNHFENIRIIMSPKPLIIVEVRVKKNMAQPVTVVVTDKKEGEDDQIYLSKKDSQPTEKMFTYDI